MTRSLISKVLSVDKDFYRFQVIQKEKGVVLGSKMEVGSVFVSGANRGIGLELVRQLVQLPKPPKYIFATYRNRDSAQALAAVRDSSKQCLVRMIKMDVTKKDDIQAARKIVEDTVGENGLNLLINNAGALDMKGFHDLNDDNLLFHFKTNTLGPIAVLKEMLPLLKRASSSQKSGLSVSRAAVLNISSMAGSISQMDERMPREFLQPFGYKVSKAALNMAMRVITQELRDTGILVVLMCPGWVKTDMGTSAGELEVQESVEAILKTCSLLNETHQGCYIDRNGKAIPF